MATALSILPDDARARLVLASDGVDTEGTFGESVARATAAGIPIDVFPIQHQRDAEYVEQDPDARVCPPTAEFPPTIIVEVEAEGLAEEDRRVQVHRRSEGLRQVVEDLRVQADASEGEDGAHDRRDRKKARIASLCERMFVRETIKLRQLYNSQQRQISTNLHFFCRNSKLNTIPLKLK